MRLRSFLLLFCATIILVGAAVYCVLENRAPAGPLASGQRVFPGLADGLGDLAWMRISHDKVKIDFAAIGGNWAVVEKGNYPASTGRVRRLLLGLAELSYFEPKTQRSDLFARLDLDDPHTGKGTLVQLQNRLGKDVGDLIVGKTRRDRLGSGNDGVYIRKPGSTQTWLARGSLDVSGDAVHWLDRRIVDIPQSRIASIKLSDDEAPPLVLRRPHASSAFAVVDPPADVEFKTDATLAQPAGALTDLNLDDVKPAPELPVPASGVRTATFETFDGLVIAVRLFRHDNLDWASFAVSGTGAAEAEAKTLNATLSRWCYALPADRAKLLRTKLADLLRPPKNS
jgi:hypothetical protein